MKADKVKSVLKNIFFGAVIGSTMSVPGVSGGSTAIMLGIYEKMISAVSNIKKQFRENLRFLVEIAVGGILGLYFVSGGVIRLTENFYFPTMYFFIGAVLGGIPLLIKRSGIKCQTLYKTIYCFFGVIAAILISFIPVNEKISGTMKISDFLIIILCGIIIAAAMVLPGISTSHILLALGMYESVWSAVHEIDILYLGLLAVGGIIGTLLTAKITEIALKNFCCQTYMIIIGFMMTTVYDIFPGIPSDLEILICALCSALGFVLIYFMGMKLNKE